MKSRPRMLTLLAVSSLLVGGLGLGRSLGQLVSFTQSYDQFVMAHRDAVVATLRLPDLPEEERDRLGEHYGELQWARRRATIPLCLANVILSLVLFAGAFESLRGNPWGRSAWSWAAKVNLPYTALASLLVWAELRDTTATLKASLTAALKQHPPTAAQLTLAMQSLDELANRNIAVLYAVLLASFYGVCVAYLRRPALQQWFATPDDRSR